MKRIAVVVLNNFVNDNRVHKIAESLGMHDFKVTVVAFLKGDVKERDANIHYDIHRIKLRTAVLPNRNKIFGALKYLEFILKISYHYRRFDVMHCNDFEAMFVGFIAKITRPKLKLVYDCHEYERERAEMNIIKKWSTRIFEPLIIRSASQVFVVGLGIQKEYKRLYPHIQTEILMNSPHLRSFERKQILRDRFQLRADQKIYLYQGGLYPSRGVEFLIDVFERMQDDQSVMVFMGFGPLTEKVKQAASRTRHILYLPAVPYDQIFAYTSSADFGFITTQNVSLNNYYCMPNKLFEYIHAEIPIITNNLHDCRAIVEANQIGTIIETFDLLGIDQALQSANKLDISAMKKRLSILKQQYTWQKEEKKLLNCYNQII
jgi:glycosyltransferase involved in cell wall biosynthesis